MKGHFPAFVSLSPHLNQPWKRKECALALCVYVLFTALASENAWKGKRTSLSDPFASPRICRALNFLLRCSSRFFHTDSSRHHADISHVERQPLWQTKKVSGCYREGGGDGDVTLGALRAQAAPQPLSPATSAVFSTVPSRRGVMSGAGTSPWGPYHFPATGK